VDKSAPVARTIEDNGEVADLLRLNEGQCLEELVHRPKAAWKDDKGVGILDEHGLAHKKVAKVQVNIQVLIG
jgi:hypothetical protein